MNTAQTSPLNVPENPPQASPAKSNSVEVDAAATDPATTDPATTDPTTTDPTKTSPAETRSVRESLAQSNLSDLPSQFVFVTFQAGVEAAVKEELARIHPHWRPAFSRPGFLTFKVPGDPPTAELVLDSAWARCWGLSLGGAQAESKAEQARLVWQRAQPVLEAGLRFDRLHVWPRDVLPAGQRDYLPTLTAECDEAAGAILQAGKDLLAHPPQSLSQPGDLVLDVVLVDPGRWWVGYHRHGRPDQSQARITWGHLPWGHLPWPGGLCTKPLPDHAVSRAYLKLDQALEWSGLPLQPGQLACELGSSPGGSVQALLDRGLSVLGIDPAAMHPQVLAHPNFRHLQRRSPAVPRREYRKVRWLIADMNVAPEYTLTAVEEIVCRDDTRCRGLLLTLKFTDPKLIAEIPAYKERVRSWGFDPVCLRQLQHHRQELCLAAWHPALRRAVRQTRQQQRKASYGKVQEAGPPTGRSAPTPRVPHATRSLRRRGRSRRLSLKPEDQPADE